MWSLRPPFMSACDPLIQAERRCNACCLNRSRWDCSLAAGRWCPVARCRQYPKLATALSNRGLPGQPFPESEAESSEKLQEGVDDFFGVFFKHPMAGVFEHDDGKVRRD